MPSNSVITIGLLWHSVNSDNLGIGALTAAHIAIVESVAREVGVSVQFVIVGWRDPRPSYVEQSNVDVTRMRARDLIDPRRLYSVARNCDIILDLSAGDSFADIYGVRRFVFNALSKSAVLAARRPLVMSPQTIGPFERWWTRAVASFLMRRAKAIVTRDRMSTEFVRTLKLGTVTIVEASDVAFRLPYERALKVADDRRRVGLNFSGLLFNGGYTRGNMFRLRVDYPKLVHALIRHFTSVANCDVHLIGHVLSDHIEVEDDYRVAQRLGEEYPGVVVAPRFADPSSAKSYISGMDFFCGSRMHACIAALSSGVPVLPIAYSRKFSGVFGSLGYDLVADCRTEGTSEVLSKAIDAFDRRDELKKLADRASGTADAKLLAYKSLLTEYFHEILARRA